MSPRTYPPVEERFWAKVDKNGPNGCWVWTAAKDKLGYGRFGIERRAKLTHKIAYEWANGPVPDGLELDHLCRNPNCCNPEHLEPVTHAENVRRGAGNGLTHRTHCPKGHEYTPENTYRQPSNNAKRCRRCNADKAIRLYHRNKQRSS